MKRTTLMLAGMLLTAAGSLAQTTTGTITYDEAVQTHIEMHDENDQLKNFFPKEIHTQHVLLFTPEASVYKNAPRSQNNVTKSGSTEEGGTFMVTMNVQSGDEIIYSDLKENKTVQQADLFSKKFLISEDTKKRTWHNTAESKTIIGYACQQAISTDNNDTVIAWYTTAIPVASGPENWKGLPGMILEVTHKSKDGDVTLIATKLEDGLKGKDLPSAPSGGKKVTREEFEAIAKAKRKEMQDQFGGGGTVIIRAEHQEH